VSEGGEGGGPSLDTKVIILNQSARKMPHFFFSTDCRVGPQHGLKFSCEE
jgi:hypothetical protein